MAAGKSSKSSHSCTPTQYNYSFSVLTGERGTEGHAMPSRTPPPPQEGPYTITTIQPKEQSLSLYSLSPYFPKRKEKSISLWSLSLSLLFLLPASSLPSSSSQGRRSEGGGGGGYIDTQEDEKQGHQRRRRRRRERRNGGRGGRREARARGRLTASSARNSIVEAVPRKRAAW